MPRFASPETGDRAERVMASGHNEISLGRRWLFKILLLYCRSIVDSTRSNERAGVQPAGVVCRGRRPAESAQRHPG